MQYLDAFNYLFTKQSLVFTTPTKKIFKNIVEKGENAGNQHFLHFPQYFPTNLRLTLIFMCKLKAVADDQINAVNPLPDDKF